MNETKGFEMLELATGEIVLRPAGETDNYVFKVAFDKNTLNTLGDSKFEVCKEMMLAGLEAAQQLPLSEKFFDPMNLSEEEKQELQSVFKRESIFDLNEQRILH